MKNILITGANGQLGNEMRVVSAEQEQLVYHFTDVAELDICDIEAIERYVVDHAIDCIVNCAAYTNVNKEAFYANYTPACCLVDATYRSAHFLLSGSLEVPGQDAQPAENRPMQDGKFVRNLDARYEDDGNTYIVVDSRGKEVLRIYQGGGYITLEEVAAYMYAFGGKTGTFPANYTSK